MTKIRREQIIEPEPLAADPFTQILLILGLLTIILIPIVRFYGKIYRERKFDMIAERGHDAFKKFVGPAQYIDSNAVVLSENPVFISASAIAINDDHLFILEPSGVATCVPWSIVRKWQWKKDGFDQIQVFGNRDPATVMQVRRANYAALRLAARNSGIFVTLVSIEVPEIRFQCDMEPVLRKWHEILTQKWESKPTV